MPKAGLDTIFLKILPYQALPLQTRLKSAGLKTIFQFYFFFSSPVASIDMPLEEILADQETWPGIPHARMEHFFEDSLSKNPVFLGFHWSVRVRCLGLEDSGDTTLYQ